MPVPPTITLLIDHSSACRGRSAGSRDGKRDDTFLDAQTVVVRGSSRGALGMTLYTAMTGCSRRVPAAGRGRARFLQPRLDGAAFADPVVEGDYPDRDSVAPCRDGAGLHDARRPMRTCSPPTASPTPAAFPIRDGPARSLAAWFRWRRPGIETFVTQRRPGSRPRTCKSSPIGRGAELDGSGAPTFRRSTRRARGAFRDCCSARCELHSRESTARRHGAGVGGRRLARLVRARVPPTGSFRSFAARARRRRPATRCATAVPTTVAA